MFSFHLWRFSGMGDRLAGKGRRSTLSFNSSWRPFAEVSPVSRPLQALHGTDPLFNYGEMRRASGHLTTQSPLYIKAGDNFIRSGPFCYGRGVDDHFQYITDFSCK